MTSTDTQSVRPSVRRPASFRPDIEGLRAIAIGLVLVYHAGVRQLPGGFVGVDVFFVISGFLITGLLIREIETHGKISLRRFYARRAKRLLPATGVVLLATAVLAWRTMSVVDWRTFGGDIVAAALYVVNWVFAGRSVDYLAEDVGASPVQHFWSLAVEEQFYIVWPLVLVAVTWLLRRRGGLPFRQTIGVAVLLLIVPSFAWSVHQAEASPETAFFATTTRLWELGIGAVVAILGPVWTRLRVGAATILGWVGLAMVTISGFVMTAETTWPGSAALLPTLGTAGVIVAGFVAGNSGPARLLSWRPAVWVGGLSYSLYLWHWPLLIAATATWGELGAKRGLLVVALAFLPAYLSYRFVENPIRFSRTVSRSNTLALSLGANFSLVGVVAGVTLIVAVPSASFSLGETVRGAAALENGEASKPGSGASHDEGISIVPAPTDATADIPIGYQDGCAVAVHEYGLKTCEYGDPNGDVTIAVVGDSKIYQWQSALNAIADEQGWRVVYFLKSSCAFSAALQVVDGEINDSCREWNTAALDAVTTLQPDVVVTSHRQNSGVKGLSTPGEQSPQHMQSGLVETWEHLGSFSIPVVVILDNPSPNLQVYECVADNPTALDECAFERDRGIASSGAMAQRAAADQVATARVIDLTDWICPGQQCMPVIGDVLVYRQGSHLTDTYVRSLTPALSGHLVPLVAELTSDDL